MKNWQKLFFQLTDYQLLKNRLGKSFCPKNLVLAYCGGIFAV